MKKTLLIIIIVGLCVISSHAQVLYSMTPSGGKYGYGTISKFLPATNELTVVKSFGEDILQGITPSGTLVEAANGKLYGMTHEGGASNFGVIFSFDPSFSKYTKLKDFDYINGVNPLGSLVQASDGKLYGMTNGGGTNGAGVIFSFDPLTLNYTKLKDFNYLDGYEIRGSLIQASDGKLYGLTRYSTDAENVERGGALFSFDIITSTYKRLMYFEDFSGGFYPNGSLMQASDGKLYGMTQDDQHEAAGAIFSYDIITSRYTTVFSFNINTGLAPLGDLIQARDGKKLYGMTWAGGDQLYGDNGVLFSFDIDSSSYNKLWNFDGINGAHPKGNLVQASDGKLYGMASTGGKNNMGVIFSLDLSTSGYTKLIDYNGTNGANPGEGSGFIEVNECIATDSTWYKDADGDGYGNPTDRVKACPRPAGYVADSTDCDDNNKAVHAPVTYYRDADSDGFGDTDHPISACSDVPPAGYVANNSDCNDNNKAIHAPVTYYRDVDGDGFGNPYKPFNLCSDAPPAGYVADSTDCEDNNKAVHGPVTYYRDVDGDGFGDPGRPISASVCIPPAGYVTNNTDCDDNNKAIHALVTYYRDFDRDGFGDPGHPIRACSYSPPAGYVKNNSDCPGEGAGSDVQTLYGTTSGGGKYGGGTINKFVPATNNFTVAKSLESIGSNPRSTFIQASDGKLYGMTNEGGTNNNGVIFSYDPLTSAYKQLKDFDGINGSGPSGSLIQAKDGKLYGMTSAGGSSGVGVIFSFEPSSSNFTKLVDFDSINGAWPNGSLMQASDGKLYGMTAQGGVHYNNGVIFSFDPSTSVYKKLMDFDNTNGVSPGGSLIQASDGKLYGLTGVGIIFSFDPLTSAYTNLAGIGSQNGSLMLANDGKLYGSTYSYDGYISHVNNIFSFDPLSSTFTKLVDYDASNGGSLGNLMQANNGKLYGMTIYGGSSGHGVIFSFDPSASIFTKLLDFDFTNGANPFRDLMQASDGKIYGMTSGGGIGGRGVIFSLDPSTSTYKKLKDFGTNETGSNFSAGLMKAKDGKLYGTTTNGGSIGFGAIFSFDPSSSAYKKLVDFNNTGGASPCGSLVQGDDGKLYGMTNGGGEHNQGVLFSFDPLTSTYSKLRDFFYENHLYEAEGVHPTGSLIKARDGKLYGMTGEGGYYNHGVIFSFDPVTSDFGIGVYFTDTNGEGPSGSLIQADDGKLYGMTVGGGSLGNGIIFSYDAATSTFTKLVDFDGINGANPFGSLIQAKDGNLYGMTSNGGNANNGVIFSYNTASSTYKKLKDFKGNNDGGNPRGSLRQASDGKLYGTTPGGSSGTGGIFSFDPSTSTYTKLKDYGGYGLDYVDNAFIEVKECITPITYYKDADGDGYGNPTCKVKASTQPAGYVADNTDCNDNNKAVHAPVIYYRDDDHDGFGDSYNPISACSNVPPAGYVKNNYDCYDHEGASDPGYVRIRMCHDGWTQCVYGKDTAEKLSLGWSLGICPLLSCGSDETLMCHNGKQECVKTTDVAAKLNEAGGEWSLGPFCSGVPISGSGSNSVRKIDIARTEKSLPTQYSLSNHPNPFAGTSTIKYELPYDSKVSIKVFDLAGRAVATLVDEYKKAGTYTVNFNATNLSSGSLFCKIIARSKEGQFERTNQMIKIK